MLDYYASHGLITDPGLAALNKMELLLWDIWGIMQAAQSA